MNLPTRIIHRLTGDEPVISVDGAFGAPGLNLSHWPGNTTPKPFRHDLSTGAALAFARLPAPERERWAGGARLIVNNHYDTDGVCAAFAVRRPDEALKRAQPLLAAARAGDFFQLPNFEALALDALVQAFADPERSPIAGEIRTLADHDRWTRAQAALIEELPALLDGGLAHHRSLWEPSVRAVRADLEDLEHAQRREEPELDLTTWIAPSGFRSSRLVAQAGVESDRFDPGRHALFGSSTSDRVLVLGPGERATSCRLIVSTLSWFDLVSEKRLARPDLEVLAGRLNELEGTRSSDRSAWRAQAQSNASPELWFGGSAVESFSEHNAALHLSQLGPERIQLEVNSALSGA